jgi:hypothetical protein
MGRLLYFNCLILYCENVLFVQIGYCMHYTQHVYESMRMRGPTFDAY